MWEKSKNSLQKFAEETTIQGVFEVYTAKNLFWKTFWLILVIITNCLTGYQIFKVVLQFQNQGTNTNIAQLEHGKLFLPPLKICYSVWFHWVDFNKVSELNITKDGLLYALSFLNNVYIPQTFNSTAAETELKQIMKLNGFETVTQFYKRIAKDSPPGITYTDIMFSNKTEFNYRDEICYVADITEYFRGAPEYDKPYPPPIIFVDMTNMIIYMEFTYADLTVLNNVTKQEYDSYILKWIYYNYMGYYPQSRLALLNRSTDDEVFFIAPPTLYIVEDKFEFYFEGVRLNPEINTFDILATVDIYRRKNTIDNPCIEGKQSYSGQNPNCLSICYANYLSTQPCGCPWFTGSVVLGEDKLDKLCNYCMFYIDDYFNTCRGDKPNENFTFVNCSKIDNSKEHEFSYCIKNCSLKGCESWNLQTTTKSSTSFGAVRNYVKSSMSAISITYPAEKNIYVMCSVDALTWEDFISNVGGLLGIWMGASILSYVQLFYICCFTICTCECFTKLTEKKENLKVRKSRINQIEVHHTMN